MNSEKVKDIKKALTSSFITDLDYVVNIDGEPTMKRLWIGSVINLINELESENDDYYERATILRRQNEQLKTLVSSLENQIKEFKDRIADLEGEITELDIINGKLEMDIELLNKQSIDLEIDRDYYQEQFNEQEDFYVEWNKQQLEQFAKKVAKRLINIKGIKEILDETLKEFIK